MVSHLTQIAAFGTEVPAVDRRLLAHQMFKAVVKSQVGSAASDSQRHQAAEILWQAERDEDDGTQQRTSNG